MSTSLMTSTHYATLYGSGHRMTMSLCGVIVSSSKTFRKKLDMATVTDGAASTVHGRTWSNLLLPEVLRVAVLARSSAAANLLRVAQSHTRRSPRAIRATALNSLSITAHLYLV